MPKQSQHMIKNLRSLTVAEAEAKTYVLGEGTLVFETCHWYCFDPNSTETANGSTVLNTAGGGRLLVASGDAQEYLDYFVGSTIDEIRVVPSSNGTEVKLTIDGKADHPIFARNIRYRTVGHTHMLLCAPAVDIELTPGTDAQPAMNYVFIDHATNLVAKSIVSMPSTPHTPIGDYLVRSAAFHVTRGILGNNHKNHLFTIGDNGHMAHVNDAITARHCIHETGLELSSTGSGTATVNLSLAAGTVSNIHSQSVSGISSPAEFFINNHETTADLVRTNLHNISTYSTGSTNLNDYAKYIFFVTSLEEATGLFCLKPSNGYQTAVDAMNDNLRYANWGIPGVYTGSAVYVLSIVARRTSSATTIHLTGDIRAVVPGTVAGGGASGVASHGSSHNAQDAIPWTDTGFSVAKEADATAKVDFDCSAIGTGTTRSIKPPDRDVDLATLPTTVLTQGSVPIVGTGGVLVEDALYFDTTNDRFGIGTLLPTAKTHIKGSTADSSAYALKLDDSADANLLNVRNDGLISLKNYSLPLADGTAGQVLTTNGSGVASFQAPPSWAILQYQCPAITVSAEQHLSTTMQDVDFSSISVTPVAGVDASIILYTFRFIFSGLAGTDTPLLHAQILFDGTLVAQTETSVFAVNTSAGYGGSFVITVAARIPSWGATAKTIKVQAAEYSAAFEVKLHQFDYWLGINNSKLHKPTLTVQEISV